MTSCVRVLFKCHVKVQIRVKQLSSVVFNRWDYKWVSEGVSELEVRE